MKRLFSLFFRSTVIFSLSIVSILSIGSFAAEEVHANFGGLSENGTAAYMGIGTATPERILHLVGNVALFERNVNSAGFIIKRTPSNRWVFGVDDPAGFVIKTYPEGSSSTARMVIDTSGRVGINTITPYAGSKLHVINDNTTSGARAIYGESNSGSTFGVYGKNSENGDYGYLGGNGMGVYGEGQDWGVNAKSTSGIGVQAFSNSGTGVLGDSVDATGVGVKGRNTGSGNYGYLGDASYGAYGKHNSTGNYGLLGDEMDGVYGNSANSYGVRGRSSNYYGVYGSSDNGTGVKGVGTVHGVFGQSGSGDGVYGESVSGWAGFFLGKVYANDKVGIGQQNPNSWLHVNGPIATAFANIVAPGIPVSYPITQNDSVLAVSANTGNVGVVLPTASSITGREYTIKRIDGSANSVTVSCTGGQLIDGIATYSLAAQWKYVTVVSDGQNWLIVANN